MLLGGANKGQVQNIKGMVIPGSTHLETDWMQLLHREVIDSIPEHHLLKIYKCNLWWNYVKILIFLWLVDGEGEYKSFYVKLLGEVFNKFRFKFCPIIRM